MPGELKYRDIIEKIIGARSSFVNQFWTKEHDFQKTCFMKKSVQSLNQCESVIQTIYDIVKAHGGELSCSSKVGEGTEFIIKFPLD